MVASWREADHRRNRSGKFAPKPTVDVPQDRYAQLRRLASPAGHDGAQGRERFSGVLSRTGDPDAALEELSVDDPDYDLVESQVRAGRQEATQRALGHLDRMDNVMRSAMADYVAEVKERGASDSEVDLVRALGTSLRREVSEVDWMMVVDDCPDELKGVTRDIVRDRLGASDGDGSFGEHSGHREAVTPFS